MVLEKAASFQISRLEKTFLRLGVSVFFLSFSVPLFALAQNPCSGCYALKRPACERRCQGSVTRLAFTSCTESCVSSSCSKFCKQSSTKDESQKDNESAQGGVSSGEPTYSDLSLDSEFNGLAGECAKCLRQKSYGECNSRCAVDEIDDVSQCRKQCAKLECSDSCSLPNEEATPDERKLTARDCGECKRGAQSDCAGNCQKLEGQPGYTSCTVSCVEEKCDRVCNPE